jgi:excinuclease UvrABC nuclease subunit
MKSGMRRWHKPIPLSRLKTASVPDHPGVYVLLSDERNLASVLKIGAARSLRSMFESELEPPAEYRQIQPVAMMYFETAVEAAEADRLLAEYRRNNGRNPRLNSPY